MAVQTVDLANIDTVIKDGVSLSEIVLDGSTIWTAPPVTSEGVNQNFVNVYSAPTVLSEVEESAISGDGLVLALVDQTATGLRVNVYSRPSTNSSNFTLLDTVDPDWTIRGDLQLSHDGSVLMMSSIYQHTIAVDDGAGSYTSNYTHQSGTSVALGSDGETFAVTGGTINRAEVYFNIGTKASPNWFLVYEAPNSVDKVSISRRDANGVVVLASNTDGDLYRYVMDQNLNWTVLNPYDAGLDLFYDHSISDDGNAIIYTGRKRFYPGSGPNYDGYYVRILINNVATNALNTAFDDWYTSSSQSIGKCTMSGDGSTAAYATDFIVINRTTIVYSKNSPFDSTDSSLPDGGDVADLSYDGYTSCLANTVYDGIPNYFITSTPENGLVNEGQSFTIHLDSFNASSGTLVDYTITGIQAADLVEPLTGSFTISNNSADLVFNVVADLTTEGTQIATITLDDYPSVSTDITILDSSTTP